jgi:hypothetical protein
VSFARHLVLQVFFIFFYFFRRDQSKEQLNLEKKKKKSNFEEELVQFFQCESSTGKQFLSKKIVQR